MNILLRYESKTWAKLIKKFHISSSSLMVCITRNIYVNGEKLNIDEIFELYSMIFIYKSQLRNS